MAYVQNWPCRTPCTPAPVTNPEPSPLPKPEPKPEPKATAAPAIVVDQTDVLVNHVSQALTQIIQPAQALPLGTLFPELNKPLTTTASPITARPTQKQIHSFAAWEMRLYLDTHPSDTIALSLFQQMANNAGQPNYASTFATPTVGGRWSWLDDPWPWEYGSSDSLAAEV